MTDKFVSLDEDGFIVAEYYKTASIDIINREMENRGVDLEHITTNKLMPMMRQCYYALYAENETVRFNKACVIPYNTENIERLFNVYLDLCQSYYAMPSLWGFERYCGINDSTLVQYVTSAKSLVIKSRKNYLQNRLSESPVGSITLANNDSDCGLMYARQNMVTQETVKRSLSFEDLKLLAERSDN